VVVMLVLAIPVLSLRLGSSDQGNDPLGSTTRQAYDLLAKGFGPGFNGPLELVSVIHATSDAGTLSRVVRDVSAQPGVASVTGPVLIPAKNGTDVALINVYPTTAPQDAGTTNLVYHLRQVTIPAAVAGSGV